VLANSKDLPNDSIALLLLKKTADTEPELQHDASTNGSGIQPNQRDSDAQH
jgi:hypothetical protein